MSLRILHCLRAPVGGLFRHVRDLAREQARRGFDVGVICDSNATDGLTEGRLDAMAADLGLGLHRVAMSRAIGLDDLAATRRTRMLCQALQVDIVHGHGAKGGAYARLAARDLKRRGIAIAAFYTPHGGSLHYDPSSLKGRVFMALERRLAHCCDGLIFESAFAGRQYSQKVGAPAVARRLIPNGLQPEEFAPVVCAADASDLLFIGELRMLKGVDVLLEAHAALAQTRPITLTIVGDGPDAAPLWNIAESLGHGRLVNFAGARPAREAFTMGRHLIVPSRAESLPYVVLEAAAAGIPLVATNVGGIPEIVADTGIALVPPDDATALADAISAMLDDPTASALLAERLKTTVASRFTVEAMCTAIADFYGAALAKRAA